MCIFEEYGAFNNLHQEILLAKIYKEVRHLNIFSMTRVNICFGGEMRI